MNDIPWYDDAACKEIDPELWFPGHGEPHSARAAKAVCHVCEVQTECLDDAMKSEADEQYRWGIYGGLDAKERKALALGVSPHHGTMRGWREHQENEETACRRCELARLTSLRRARTPQVPTPREAAS